VEARRWLRLVTIGGLSLVVGLSKWSLVIRGKLVIVGARHYFRLVIRGGLS
jgi:hypothetical protein